MSVAEKTFEEIIAEYLIWSEMFEGGSEELGIKHLNEEIREVVMAEDGSEHKLEEYVDVLMLAFYCSKMAGYTLPQLIEAFRKKFVVNLNRTWYRTSDGGYRHVKK